MTVYSRQVFPKIHPTCFSGTPGSCSGAQWPSKSPHISSHTLFLQQTVCTHSSCSGKYTSYSRAQGNFWVTGHARWISVGVLLQRWPVYVRVRNLSVEWAASGLWRLKSVGFPQGWHTHTHTPVSKVLCLWIHSWTTSDGPKSNVMDHLLLPLSSFTEEDE